MNWQAVEEEIRQIMLHIGDFSRDILIRLDLANDLPHQFEILYQFNTLIYKLNECIRPILSAYADVLQGNPPSPEFLAIDPNNLIWGIIFTDNTLEKLKNSNYANIVPYTLFDDYNELCRNVIDWMEHISHLLKQGFLDVAYYSYEALFFRIATAEYDSRADDAYRKLLCLAKISIDKQTFRNGCKNALSQIVHELERNPNYEYGLRVWMLGKIWQATLSTSYELQIMLNMVWNDCANFDPVLVGEVLNNFVNTVNNP